MSLDPPRLDDTDAAALLAAARAEIARRGAGWDASEPADPGTALLEAFAHVTAEELTRLNRLPQAAQRIFFSTLGLRINPSVASTTQLVFTLPTPRAETTAIPQGTRVAAMGQPDIVFSTLADAVLPPGATRIEADAARVALVVDETVALGSGVPGQSVKLAHSPLPGAPARAAKLSVLVEALGEPLPGTVVEQRGGRSFVRYAEVGRVEPSGDRAPVFEIDRVAGRLTFPLAGAHIPDAGAEIRADYAYVETSKEVGLAAGSLSDLLSPLPGVQVSNPDPVPPGRPPETVEAALRRGALARLVQGVAIRDRDYEAIALGAHPGVARAEAEALAQRWRFAAPGTVSARIIPTIMPNDDGAVTLEDIRAVIATRGEEILGQVSRALEAARPLGVALSLDWMTAKSVGTSARVFVARGADTAAIRQAVTRRLNALICPVAGGIWPQGWPLGRDLRQSEVIETVAATPGVRAADRVVLRPRNPMSGALASIAADPGQPGLWFALMGGRLYRSIEDGVGWMRLFPDRDETPSAISALAVHPARSGTLAVAQAGGQVRLSHDGGQNFRHVAQAEGAPHTLAWLGQDGAARLLVGDGHRLGQVHLPEAGQPPRAVAAFSHDGAPFGGVYAIAAHADGRGGRLVALARSGLGGVLFSPSDGEEGSFVAAGLRGHDIRVLCFLQQGERVHLIAGAARPVLATHAAVWAAAVDLDTGRLGPWQPAVTDWQAGGVACLAAQAGKLLAGTHADGLRSARLDAGVAGWDRPGSGAGLPVDELGQGRAAITAAAFAPARAATVLVGGAGYLLRSTDGGDNFEDVTERVGAERIAVPRDSILCPDTHDIEVVVDDETV